MWVLILLLVGLMLLGKYGPLGAVRSLLLGFWYLVKGVFWVVVAMFLLVLVLRVLLGSG